jgi:hypothetical protein
MEFPMSNTLDDTITKKAHSDGAYAVANALLSVAQAQLETARSIQRLGNADAATHLGAIEGLSIMTERVAKALESIASAMPGES